MTMHNRSRRDFLRDLLIGSAALASGIHLRGDDTPETTPKAWRIIAQRFSAGWV
jgi:hypothetical protein